MTDSGSGKFRYSLDPFLKKRRLDWGCVKLDEARARAVVELHKNKEVSVQDLINEVEQALRQSSKRGALIDRDLQQNMSSYLTQTYRGLGEIRKQLEQASKVHEQVTRDLNVIRQGIKALEKHKTRKQAEHSQEARRREYNQLDELWLLSGNSNADTLRGRVLPRHIKRISRKQNGGSKNGG